MSLKQLLCSGAGIVSHIPWILEFLKYLPQKESPLAALQSIGAQLVKERTEKGSNKQDLFYWLVSLLLLSVPRLRSLKCNL